MSKHLEELEVIALRDTSITIPSPEVVRKGDIKRMPRWAAETLIELGDFRLYGKSAEGASEDKALRPARKVKANRGAKNLAAEHGLDLANVEPTGAGGRITKTDVKNYLKSLGIKP
jgi:pyruvate/2-oxoglutarate dehydrogenase complex dihydrolipoamide acyltransferase (E2) component